MKKLIVIMCILLLNIALVLADPPTPHSISGYVYADGAKTTQVAWGTSFTITDTDSTDFTSGTTGGGPFSGWYGDIISGVDGDTIIVRAENSSHYGETQVILSGDMYTVDVIMDNPKSQSAKVKEPTRIVPIQTSLEEVEPGDKTYFEVSVENTGATAISKANITLDILNYELYSVSWGPNSSESENFSLDSGSSKTINFNNSEANFTVPNNSLEGIHYLDVLFTYDGFEFPNKTNFFYVRKITNISDVNSTITPSSQLAGLNSTYNVSFYNPFLTGNLTNISTVVNSNKHITCQEKTTGATIYNITSIENNTIINIIFNCAILQNITTANYSLSVNLSYYNPNNYSKSKSRFALSTLTILPLRVSMTERQFIRIK